jgi:hypothetical protein
MERLLLMAAAVQGRTSESDIDHANTAKIVAQVLWWTRPDFEAIQERWRAADYTLSFDEVYDPLVHMTQSRLRSGGFRPAKRPGPALFEGSGNWGSENWGVPGELGLPPADPLFNSCRLTSLGEQIARALLAQNPAYAADATAGDLPPLSDG